MIKLHQLAALLLSFALCAVFLQGCGGGDAAPVPTPAPAPALRDVNVPGLGVLQGSVDGDVAYFKGIPYAQPPEGPLRWQPPRQHGPWESPRDATDFGPACVQATGFVTWERSEDCLLLHVATPASALQATSLLPVMFWIHGGAYRFGAGNETAADTLVMASNLSVVVVTFNYRLNAFGFLGSAEITASTDDSSAGNFGIQDQRMAMAWVKQHIAAFGGDGDKITIFGESAGGNSVMNHLAQPGSFPLYTKAVVQSGTYSEGALPMLGIGGAQEHYDKVLTDSGCANLDCLKGKDAAEILAVGDKVGIAPVVDGVELAATPVELIAQGQHNKVPILIGATRDEFMSSWFGFDFTLQNEADFDRWAGPGLGPSRLAQVKELYDPSVYPYPADLGPYSIWTWKWGRVLTDRIPGLGHCGTRWLAKMLLAAGTPAVYAYSFDHPPQGDNVNIPGTGPGSVVASHAVEIPFVFGELFRLVPGEEVRLALDMSAYWVAFSKTGNPNMQGLPTWPLFTAESDTIMRLDVAGAGGIRTEQYVRKAACDFWEDQLGNATDAGEEQVQLQITV